MIILDSAANAIPAYNSVFGFWPIISYIVSAIICIFLGYIFNALIGAILSKLFSRFNSIFYRKNKKLSGAWTHIWHVDSTRFPKENTATLKLNQYRNIISANYKVKDVNGAEYTYAMKGKIDSDSYISGEWYDVYAGNTYHGTFMLYIDVNMDSMTGIWIGKSQDNKVKSGKWEWKRE